MDNLFKIKKYAIISLVILVIVLVLYFVFKKKIKEWQTANQSQPSDNSALTTQEQDEVKRIANALHNDLKGWSMNIFGRDGQAYADLASANDRITIGVYNYFNTNFCKAGETLWTWINGDTFLSTSLSGNSVLIIKDKFKRLKLI